MTQFARPIADEGLNLTWTNVPIYAEIDEVSPSDADYSGPDDASGGHGVFEGDAAVQLSSLTDPGVSTGHIMKVRLAYQNANQFGDAMNFFVNLYQGDPLVAGSYIATLDTGSGSVLTAVSGTSGFTTYTYTLSGAEANTITDYTDLWIEMFGENSSFVDFAPWGPGAAARWLRVSWFELEVPGGIVWWTPDNGALAGQYKQSADAPTSTFDFGIFWEGIFYPPGTVFTWHSTTAPDNTGWWSSDVQYNGAAVVTDNSRPKDPRGYVEITAFANGSAGVFGGFPGVAATINNRMVYAPGGYTVGTTVPTLRMFDGVSDREVATLPKTASGGVPKGVMTILVTNGTVYLTTLDSGSSAADFAGRVFSLDLESGNLTQIGSTFTAGQLPYCLAWHNGRLWVGTNSGDPGVTVGKVSFWRPGVDTDWTVDKTLTAACAICMLSYKGLLYVGCSAPAATFAKVLVRGTDNAYTTSDTGSGGTARKNNAYLAMAEFGGNLYATFWNPDTPAVSQIRKFDNSSWSTVYSEATHAIFVPWIALPQDFDTLLALGGGVGYARALVSTTNGTSWSDRTVFATQSDTPATGVPAFGTVVR